MRKLGILIAFVALSQGVEITFGSCAGMFGKEKEAIWKAVEKRDPDVFVWLGDAVYADEMVLPLVFRPVDEERWRLKYEKSKNAAGYRELREKVRILGVWDDHDYGANNENKYFAHKELSKKLFLEFLDEPLDSLRYQREGIYESYVFVEGNIRIKVILLDNRTYLDPNGKDSDVLGEIQWTWLEDELKDSAVELFIIMNGMQINVEDRLTATEKWFPKSRNRLLGLLKQHPNSLLVSGDVHHSEILEVCCNQFRVIEFTSSGLTHSVSGTYGKLICWFIDFWYPYTSNLTPRTYTESFGSIEVNGDGKIELKALDENGKIVFEHSLWLKELLDVQENRWYCGMGLWRRRVGHWASFILVFVAPWASWVLSSLLFIRKYSNSY